MSKRRIIVVILFIIMFLITIIVSYFYYNNKYVVHFETGTDEKILDQFIKKGDNVLIPGTLEKDGYIFLEWQLDGEKYNFSNPVTEDLILTAKWMKEEYITINYNTDSIYKIDSIEILKGSVLENIPFAYKDGYEFIGWYIDDKLYNKEPLYNNVILTAKYNVKKINDEYKVKDNVLIIDSYSNSAFNTKFEYEKAIGWIRTILYINEDWDYPYMVGNDNGVTGFFKANSLKKI